MTDPRHGAGDLGPGVSSPGPTSFPATSQPTSSGYASRPGLRPVPSPGSGSPVSGDPGAVSSSSSSTSVGSSDVPGVSADPAPVDARRPPEEVARAAAEVFGERLELAGRFTQLLATEGVVRGLIGPRETPRLWERHLVNCGVMSQLFPFGSSVVDVGSGAGLPGIVLAVARPDLVITLVEPLARRTAFLTEAVDELGLDNVTVVRGRAEEVAGHLAADIVTARAVAALDKLAGWCLPLARTGGLLLALKGSSAAEEIADHTAAIARLGGGEPVIRICGEGLIEPPATVVEIVKERDVVPVREKKTSSGRAAGSGNSGAGGRGAGRRRSRRG
ncbi:16S rRNA (guanine(527)-N(7))-methyltransferase RsmG [Actinoplanes sp. NPDC051851]|uniref:16S rRNA (guanine(527)-N(7))-methyltransferase RsmG n=1 Tax=Actinoplanes sp. NPDC051851 TaxID=3154753 RepID=UPI003435A314